MNNEQKQRNAKLFLTSGIAGLILGAILLMVLGPEKETLEYYWSSDRRSAVDMGIMLSWGIIIWSVVELVYSLTVLSSNGQADAQSQKEEELPEATFEWLEGELVDREWDDKNPRVEWFVLRQKNGLTIRVWHNISDDMTYRVGMRGLIRAVDRQITEFIPAENVK